MPKTNSDVMETKLTTGTKTSMKTDITKTGGLSKEKIVQMYKDMLLIRRFEEKTAQMYGMGKIGGFCHLYIGQEATGVGAISTLTADDYIVSSYRDHGHILAVGADPKKVMAELYGKATGYSKGKGGSMHLFDKEKNMLGGYGIVAGQVPLATGVAFAIKYRKENRVIVCFFGEGAANQGVFHESMNLAALWKLPIVFICENNRYGMGTAVERASAIYDLSQKALAYDMARDRCDGMDVRTVYNCVSKAVNLARREKKPTLIEVVTYRFRGHSMSDPIHSHYRTKEEVEEMKKQDPITRLAGELVQEKILAEQRLEEIEQEVKKIISDAVEFSEKSSDPTIESMYEDVYVKS